MKTLIDKIYMVLLAALLLSAAGCSDDDDTSLALNGDTWITSFHIEGYDNFIVEQDNQARSIKVHVEDNTDVTNLFRYLLCPKGLRRIWKVVNLLTYNACSGKSHKRKCIYELYDFRRIG